MNLPNSHRFLIAGLIASVALSGCGKKDEDQVDAKAPAEGSAEGSSTKSGDTSPITPPKAPAEEAIAPTSTTPDGTTPDGTAGTTPPESTALAPIETPGDNPSGEATDDPTNRSTKDPTKDPNFVPGEVSDVGSDDKLTTQALLEALPESPHSIALQEAIALSDQLLLALDGANDAPTALAALTALDPKFAEIGGKMSSLGIPDEETSELFGEVLASKEDFNARIRAATKRLSALDSSLTPEEAGRKANLESAQLHRAVTTLIGHYQKAWPTVRPKARPKERSIE